MEKGKVGKAGWETLFSTGALEKRTGEGGGNPVARKLSVVFLGDFLKGATV